MNEGDPTGPGADARRTGAFTLVELLVVVAIIAILAGLLLPALARVRTQATALYCGNQVRQLQQALLLYAEDNADRFVYNLDSYPRAGLPPVNLDVNWVNHVLNWELDAANTNLAFILRSPLGSYLGRAAAVFTCPSDHVVSEVQREAGWSHRVRSISLNAMIGDAGANVTNGTNIRNPGYRQFLRAGEVKAPSATFTFIEEHPDSIGDGYFLNRLDDSRWTHLPASYHSSAANLTFVDGHLELHRWQSSDTCRPARPDAGPLPFPVPPSGQADFGWLAERTSAEQE